MLNNCTQTRNLIGKARNLIGKAIVKGHKIKNGNYNCQRRNSFLVFIIFYLRDKLGRVILSFSKVATRSNKVISSASLSYQLRM